MRTYACSGVTQEVPPLLTAAFVATMGILPGPDKLEDRQAGRDACGSAMAEKGFEVRLADSSWDNIRTARTQGLQTYHGNSVSDHADRHLDLVGIGRLLGLSYVDDLNALAALRYRSEFGAGEVYTLQPSAEKTKG